MFVLHPLPALSFPFEKKSSFGEREILGLFCKTLCFDFDGKNS